MLVLLLLALTLIFKGGARGRVCVVMIVLGVLIGDTVICNTLKQSIGRLRPFNDILDAHVLGGRGDSGSLPSSHAANWFMATIVALIYYRRSVWFVLPLALLVSFSRIYNGMHYPGDVLVGAIVGAGTGAGVVIGFNSLWQWLAKTSLFAASPQPITSLTMPPALGLSGFFMCYNSSRTLRIV